MAIQKAEDVQNRIKNGFDRKYHDQLHNLLCWAFGEKEKTISNTDGGFPDYPDVMPAALESGKSRRILNAQFTRLTSALYGEPEPDFPDLDRWTGEVLKQFYVKRSRGETGAMYGDEEWMPERALAFLEGDGVGVGWLQIGLRTNPATNLQRVRARHVPATHVIWDPYVTTPARATWVCFVHNLDPDQARSLYGKDAVDEGLRDSWDGGAMTNRKVFRVFEYYDKGIGDSEPTMALIPGGWDKTPIAVVANPFGYCLPCSHYEHFTPPGFKRPIGRILLQIGSQDMLNRIEEKIRRTVDDGDATDLMDISALEDQDVKALKDGKAPRFLRFTKFWDGKPPFVRLPARDMAPTVMQHYNMLDRQMTEDSGMTDQDRGLLSNERRTLGENQMVADKAATKASWSRMQAAKMERRTVEKVLYIAKMFDRDPISLDVFGSQVLINDPKDPRSWIANFLQETSSVLIDEASLEYQDTQRKQAMRLGNLNQLMDLVARGVIDPRQLAIEKLKAIGEKDPESWLAQAPMMPPGAPGAPGMAVPGAMPPGMPPSPAMPPA